MLVVEIPLVSRPMIFNVSLGGTPYRCRTQWNRPAQVWIIDIADQIGTPILSGIPLITGSNLLEQFPYAGVQGALFVRMTMAPPDDVPGYYDFGDRGHLYFAPWEQPE